MANKTVFNNNNRVGRKAAVAPATDTVNKAGGAAYSMSAEHALAQLACTGVFNDTFYVSAQDQLSTLVDLADKCSPTFLAKVAVYARECGYMKDMPAALAVLLSKKDPALLDKIFDRVIDNGKQLRNYVQFVRSGKLGRKSLGSVGKRLIRRWFAQRSDESIFRASVGNDPSLADVIKLARPRPLDVIQHVAPRGREKGTHDVETRRALYAYLIGREHNVANLPQVVKDYESWKSGNRDAGNLPNVDFRMLTNLKLSPEDWAAIARRGAWHQTRINLNTYLRHGVFDIPGMEETIVNKLTDPSEIRKAKAFPYQLLAAYLNCSESMPSWIKVALQQATEIAVDNVPAYAGRVAVVVDTSGSMGSPVTGHRKGATTAVTCVDVAALMAACVMRKNPNTAVVPVDTVVHSAKMLNPMDSIVTNADKLRRLGGGGTDLGAAMRFIETAKLPPDLIIMVSDNESWYDPTRANFYRGSAVQQSWARIRKLNPMAKMVCIDLIANDTTQAVDGHGVLNIGGFSDRVWDTINRFVADRNPQAWVDEINAISLSSLPDNSAVQPSEPEDE